MTRWLYRPKHHKANDNGMVPADLAYGDSDSNSAPYVISDDMEATRHMADGRMFTSKSKFREHTKATGHFEIGNELPTMLKPRKPFTPDRSKRRDDIRRTIYDLRNGIRRGE